MKIAVDFDGTLVDHRFPDIGAPVPGAFAWLRAFQEVGHELFLYTMRSDGQDAGNVLTQAVDYCREQGIEFAGVNRDPSQDSWTESPKCYAERYIDDAAIGCPLRDNPRMGGGPMVDWDIVGPMVMALVEEKVSP